MKPKDLRAFPAICASKAPPIHEFDVTMSIALRGRCGRFEKSAQ
jgi:hypothetical protein